MHAKALFLSLLLSASALAGTTDVSSSSMTKSSTAAVAGTTKATTSTMKSTSMSTKTSSVSMKTSSMSVKTSSMSMKTSSMSMKTVPTSMMTMSTSKMTTRTTLETTHTTHTTHHATHTSVMTECKKIFELERLVMLAGNATKLDKEAKGDATKISELKAQASEAVTELKTLEANATLVAICAKLKTEEMLRKECAEELKLERAVKIVGNATELAEWEKKNATKAEEFKAEASKATTVLAKLQSNATLNQFCAFEREVELCHELMSGARLMVKSVNETFILIQFKGDETLIEEFKVKVEQVTVKVNKLMNNATLVADCQRLFMSFASTMQSANITVAAVASNGTSTMGSMSSTATGAMTTATGVVMTSGAIGLNASAATMAASVAALLLGAFAIFVL